MKKTGKFGVFLLFLLTFISIIAFTLFSYLVATLNIIPQKYFVTGYLIIFIIFLLLIMAMSTSHKTSSKIISSIFMVILDFLFIASSFYLNDTNKFLNNLTVKKEYLNYSVVTRINTFKYEELTDKYMGYIKDDSSELVKANISGKMNIQFREYLDIFTLYNDLLDKNIDSFVIDSTLLSILEEEEEDITKKVEVVYTFNLELDVENKKDNDNITENPFILYISGIDQYGDVNTTRGRSDVNILAIVNPKQSKILLLNTPRDYYVQLSGTTGLRDKLTHAGIYGIEKSITTLESIYDINVDHYVRINFNTLIRLIDLIGGIDIESDTEFTCHTNRNIHINKGFNHLDGTAALAYSRERYAYIDGDHHRGRNQEQVITAIINKLTTSTSFVTKYSSILSTMSNSFQTDMDSSTISEIIKYQIEYMPKWNIESTAVTGTNSMNYTYSMGTNYLLYVMEPDYDSINEAKNKIQEYLSTNSNQ